MKVLLLALVWSLSSVSFAAGETIDPSLIGTWKFSRLECSNRETPAYYSKTSSSGNSMKMDMLIHIGNDDIQAMFTAQVKVDPALLAKTKKEAQAALALSSVQASTRESKREDERLKDVIKKMDLMADGVTCITNYKGKYSTFKSDDKTVLNTKNMTSSMICSPKDTISLDAGNSLADSSTYEVKGDELRIQGTQYSVTEGDSAADSKSKCPEYGDTTVFIRAN